MSENTEYFIRVNKSTNYRSIHTASVEDESLSAKATGILVYLITRKDGEGFTREDIQNSFSDGEKSIRTGLQELEEAGYLVRERERNEDGTYSNGVWTIYDAKTRITSGRYPDAVFRHVDNRHVVKKKKAKKRKKKENDTKERKKKKVYKKEKNELENELGNLLGENEVEKLTIAEKSYLGSLEPSTIDSITEVYRFWKKYRDKRRQHVLDSHSRTSMIKLTKKRARKVRARLREGYTVEQLKRAIVGMCSNEYNVRKGYDDLELACRNQQKVDQYLRWAEDGPPSSRSEPTNGGGARETRVSEPEKVQIDPSRYLS